MRYLYPRQNNLLLRRQQLQHREPVTLRQLGKTDDIDENNRDQAARMMWRVHGYWPQTVAAWPSA